MENTEDKTPIKEDKYTTWLYNTLKQNNSYNKDYTTFYNDFYAPGIKGYSYRKGIYDDMTSHGIDLGATYEDFASKMGLHAVEPTEVATPMNADSVSNDMSPIEVNPNSVEKKNKPLTTAHQQTATNTNNTAEYPNRNFSTPMGTGAESFTGYPGSHSTSDNYYKRKAISMMENADKYFETKSLDDIWGNASSEQMKKASQAIPKEQLLFGENDFSNSFVGGPNSTIHIKGVPDGDPNITFESALNNETILGATVVFDEKRIDDQYNLWKDNRGGGGTFPVQVTAYSVEAQINGAKNRQAKGLPRPAYISQKAWDDAANMSVDDAISLVGKLKKISDEYLTTGKIDNDLYTDVSVRSVTGSNINRAVAMSVYNSVPTTETFMFLFPDGRERPLQAPKADILQGGKAAQTRLLQDEYNNLISNSSEGAPRIGTFKAKGKIKINGTYISNGESFYFACYPYRISRQRINDNYEGLNQHEYEVRHNKEKNIDEAVPTPEKAVLFNDDNAVALKWVIVKQGQSAQQAIEDDKRKTEEAIRAELPTELEKVQGVIAQANDALKQAEEDYNAALKSNDEMARSEASERVSQLKDAIQNLEKYKDYLKTGEKAKWYKGLWRGLSDLDGWTFGLYSLSGKISMARSAVDGKLGEAVQDKSRSAIAFSQYAQSKFDKYVAGPAYRNWLSTGKSLQYSAQFLVGGGVGKIVGNGVVKTFDRLALRFAEKQMTNLAIKGAGRFAAAHAEGAVMTALQSGQVLGDASMEHIGTANYHFDGQNHLVVDGLEGKSWGKAITHSFASALNENTSEIIGARIFAPISARLPKIDKSFFLQGDKLFEGSLSNFAKNGGKFSTFLTKTLPYERVCKIISSGKFKEGWKQYNKILKQAGFDGVGIEYLEEVESNIVSATMGDMTWDDVIDSKQNAETALCVLTSSALLGAGHVMLGTGSYISAKNHYNRQFQMADAEGRQLFGNDAWEDITNRIVNCNDDVMVQNLQNGILDNRSLSREQKKAVYKYIAAQRAQAIFNNAFAQRMTMTPNAHELNEANVSAVIAYDMGRNMQTPEEYEAAEQRYNDTRDIAAKALGVEDIDAYLDGLGESTAQQLQNAVGMAKADGLDANAVSIALSAYLCARETRKGALEAQSIDKDIRKSYVDREIDNARYEGDGVNEEKGDKSVTVSLNDGSNTFLIRGRIENNQVVGDNAVVRDEFGEIRMIPTNEITGIVSETDLQQAREQAYNALEQSDRDTQARMQLEIDVPVAGQIGTLIDEEGHREEYAVSTVFNDENGEPKSVLLTNKSGKNYVLPIVVFNRQRMNGRKFEAIRDYLDESDPEYHATEGAMNEQYKLPSEDEANTSEQGSTEEASTPIEQGTTDASQSTKHDIAIGNRVKIKDDNGNTVNGHIVGINEEGLTIEFESPYNGRMVDQISPEDFDSHVSEITDEDGNVLWDESEEVGNDVVTPQDNVVPTNTGLEEGTTPEADQTATTEETFEPTALERIPKDEQGNPIYEQTDAETAFAGLTEEAGNAIDAEEIAKSMVEDKEKALEKAKKKKLPSGVSAADKVRAIKERTQAITKAQEELDKWKAIAEVPAKQRAKVEEERIAKEKAEAEAKRKAEEEAKRKAEAEWREREARLHDEAVARLEEQKRIAAEKAKEQAEVGTHAVNPKIKAKWDGAAKVEGNPNALTLADGSTLRGHYVLTEAGAATASHDINNAFEPTDGFPIDENGESVNDRDYQRDTDAQQIVRNIADNYDSRALQSPVIVSKDGVVLSGNNRTMSGDMAAQQGTDKAYIDHLREFGQMYGFTPEQIDGMKHPRVVFVPDETLPYDASTFARFNAEQQKKQSKPEQAVKLGKIVPDNVFNSIVGDISRFDRLSDYYADSKAVDSAISQLHRAGVINEMQLPELRTGNTLSAAGRELIENTLIGKVFQTSPDAVRQIISTPTLRQSVIMGLNEIAHNRTLAKSGYDLSKELGAAVDLVARAKSAHPDIFKEGMPVSPFGRQQGLFDDEYGDSRVTDAIVLLLSDVLNSGKPGDLRKVLATYNNEAEVSAGGQLDMFSGKVTSKEELLNRVIEYFRNATPKEQQAIVDAAVAERKRRAETSEQVGDTAERDGGSTNQQGTGRVQEETRNDVANKTMSHDEAIAFIAVMENRAEVAPSVDLSIDNWDALFGKDGIVNTPIGEVKMGDNQFTKMMREDRHGKLGMVKPTLENPDVILEDASKAKEGDTEERPSSYIFVKAFKKADGSRYYYFTSITVSKDGREVVVSNQEKRKNAIANLLSKDKLVWKHADDVSDTSDVAQGLYSSQGNVSDLATEGTDAPQTSMSNKEVYNRHTTAKQPVEAAETSQDAEQGDTQTSSSMNVPTSSNGKDINNQSTLQKKGEKSSIKTNPFGKYQEAYDSFVSDVEKHGMIPDLRAIKNKIRDTKRRLTILRNGAATSIQSDEDLKRFESKEKDLSDMLHAYEAMRDYVENKIKESESEAQSKPWNEKNAQERMDEASNNPLTEEEIQNAPTDEVNKANALDFLYGNHGLIQSISYLKVYEDVRNPNGGAAPNSGTTDKTQLAGEGNPASKERNAGGRDGGRTGRVDNEGSTENVPEQSDGGKSGEGSTRDNVGEGSDTGVSAEEQPVGGRDSNGGKSRRGGTSGRTRSNGGRSGRKKGGDSVKDDGKRGTASESVKDDNTDDFLRDALDEFKDVLDEFNKAGRGELSISLVGLNSKQMEVLPRLIQAGAKVGYAYIRKGVHNFAEWAKRVKEAIGQYLRNANLSEDEIDAFIKEMWKSKIPFDGQTHTLEEWASIYGKQKLREKVKITIEEKREAQRQAEKVPVKTGDIDNIRENLPFLLPQQQEDVLKAETQFFDESHQDREHAYGKGYMFTNGTGTGKTYTGLGIVKRFVKQGKKRILILTPSQPKVRDWINDGKNLGLKIRSLDDWAKERGTTATTEAGEGTIITTYANFRQNEALLHGTFDLIVYDESHRLMENKQAANTAGTEQHHMMANRDVSFATMRLRKINPHYQELDKLNKDFNNKRNELVEKGRADNPSATEGALIGLGLVPRSSNIDDWNKDDAERFPEFEQLRNRFVELRKFIIQEIDPQIEEQAKKDVARTKVVFLSATPFNTRENIDYAQGYIFSYPEREQARGYQTASPQTLFFEEHFGAAYRWRYGRLEHSEKNAEAIAQQEREFSDWLQHTLCTMSGRIIDSEYDYSRDFPVVSVEHAEEINRYVDEIAMDEYFSLAYRKVFCDYNYSGALFETLKVAALIPRIKQHLAAGRKVVIFHRRVESKKGVTPPFATMLNYCESIIAGMKQDGKPKEDINAARHRLDELKKKWRNILLWEATLDYSMPREQIAKVFGADNVLFFSGLETTKEKNRAVDSFNDDESGKNIIVIQEASGKEGISLHDTTGKHQRVLISLALPQSPITALQTEGRIYRIGNRSNAIFEYPLLGLNSEIILFGQKFNGQIGTTENLALGSQARNLRESYARGVEESGDEVPIEEQGVGGKEADAAEREETAPFDRAVLDYYGNQKINGSRDSREGIDYYPTPEPLGFKMVEWGCLNDGETALEPSAGHGAIARYVPSANPLTAIEPSQSLFAKLQLKAGGSGRKFVNTIFEGYNVVNKHDVVFMNPPFGTGGRLAVDHVAKAFTHLTEGGRIVAIIPRGSTDKKFDKWLDEQDNAVVTGEILLPDITFQQAGTSIMARVVVIDKVTNPSLREKAESKYRSIDLSHREYDKIEDFFEDIRDIQMPSRTIDEKARMLKRAASVLRDIKDLKGIDTAIADEAGIYIKTTRTKAMSFYLDFKSSDVEAIQQQLQYRYKQYTEMAEWSARRHDEKSMEIYQSYRELICKMLGKTPEEIEIDESRKKMQAENPRVESNETAVDATSSETEIETPSVENTGNAVPYHYELKHHTRTGAEMYMAMPNKEGGLSNEAYSSMLAKAKKYDGYWNRFMKGFAFPSEEKAKGFLSELGEETTKAQEMEGKERNDYDDKPRNLVDDGNKYRQGEELSPNHEIRIVEGNENHGFKNYKEAKTWAKSNIARTYTNEETGGKGEIRISNAAIDKYLSESAVEKSDSKDVHLAVLRVLPDVIRESVDAEQHADYLKDEDGVRSIANGINPDVTIHRLYGAVNIGGKTYRVKVTLKENKKTGESTKAYSYEATKIELLAGQHGGVTMTPPRNSNNSITAANLLKGVEKSYGAGRFFENYSEESSAKTQAAKKAAEKLNLGDRIVVHETAEGLDGKEATAKGWYDTETGQVHVVVSNNMDEADVTQTVLHEVVAHHGLRELLGRDLMAGFLDSVFGAASKEIKAAINELRRGNGWNMRTATEEYLAGLAERTDFDKMTKQERGFFAAVRRMFYRVLNALGIRHHQLSDRELAYLLWCSYQNLKTGEKGKYVAMAERVAMQYKLKVGKYAEVDAKKRENAILFRQDVSNRNRLMVRDEYERQIGLASHKISTIVQDSMQPLLDLQRAIEKASGRKLKGFENAYLAENRMSSMNYAQMDMFKKTLYADMVNAINEFSTEGKSYQDVLNYVYMKHAIERNDYMAEQEAQKLFDAYKAKHPNTKKTLDDFREITHKNDYAGLVEHMNHALGTSFQADEVDQAMSDAEFLTTDFEQGTGSLTDGLWDAINGCTKETLRIAYEGGMISRDTYNKISGMYQYYIPLRGFSETTSDEVYEYFGDTGSLHGGNVMKRARGRKSEADDPFATIGNMAELAISQANRNKMKQHFYFMVMNNPSDAVSISDLYVKKDVQTGQWIPVDFVDSNGDPIDLTDHDAVEQFNEDMEDLCKNDPDNYAHGYEKPNIPYRVLGSNMDEHQVHVKINGRDIIMTINGNPRAAQALNGQMNPDATDNPYVIALNKTVHVLAAAATAKNPVFTITNLSRDLMFSTTSLMVKEGREYTGAYVKNVGRSFANLAGLIYRYEHGKLDMSNELDKLFAEFIKYGGETGYTFQHSVEAYKGEISKALKGKKHYGLNDAWHVYDTTVTAMNRWSEDIARFSTYVTSRQRGRGIEQSIYDAKEVTVNFNKKGAAAKGAEAGSLFYTLLAYGVQIYRSSFMFANAGIQGLKNYAMQFKEHPVKASVRSALYFGVGMMAPYIAQALCMAIGGDPDDYYNLPDYVRRNNLCIRIPGGNFITIPLAIEDRAFYGLGELMSSQINGGSNYEGLELDKEIAAQITQALPIDAAEGDWSGLAFVPSTIRPIIEVEWNKDWTGVPVYKDNTYTPYAPAFKNGFQSTNQTLVDFSRWLNKVQGGDDVERKGFQINPAIAEHLIEGYFGGVGKFANKTYKSARAIFNEEERTLRNIPFVSTFIRATNDDRTKDQAVSNRFFNAKKKADEDIYVINGYIKEAQKGNQEYANKLNQIEGTKRAVKYYLWKQVDKTMTLINKAKNATTDEVQQASLDATKRRIQKMAVEADKAIDETHSYQEAENAVNRIFSQQ